MPTLPRRMWCKSAEQSETLTKTTHLLIPRLYHAAHVLANTIELLDLALQLLSAFKGGEREICVCAVCGDGGMQSGADGERRIEAGTGQKGAGRERIRSE